MLTLHAALSLALDPAAPDVVAVVGGGGKSNAVFRLAKDAHAATGRRAIITHTARIAAFQDAWAPMVAIAGDNSALPWPAIAAALDAHGCILLTAPSSAIGAGGWRRSRWMSWPGGRPHSASG
jgi:hypothetical protein